MDAEVVIVGGALFGAALARALAGSPLALVSQERRVPGPIPAVFDSRVYAISPANAAFLAELGAWQQIPAQRLTPVHAMRIWGDDGRSKIEFDAYQSGVSELAWIVEDALLQDGLWRLLQTQERLEVVAPAEFEWFEASAAGAKVALRDGRCIEAKLAIGADGARSLLRMRAGIGAREHAYGQSAVVANFACERPHRNVALQWFQGGPVLALLPLPGERVSMVWSTADVDAVRLLELDGDSLAREVAHASGHTLGELSLLSPPRSFPLRSLVAARSIGQRAALVGDAAHVVHPLAGQGANLGFQDARALAETLRSREPFRDPGDLRLLRRYERARAEAILAMRATVHGLFLLFGAQERLFGPLRNAGLNLVDRLPVLKNVLMRRAMN